MVSLGLANMGCDSMIRARVPNPASAAKCVKFCRRLSVYPRVNSRVSVGGFERDDCNDDARQGTRRSFGSVH